MAGVEHLDSSTAEANEQLVRSYLDEVVNQRRDDRLDDYIAADYRGHGFPPDREALRAFLRWQARTAPDWTISVHDAVARDDRVAIRATATGTRAEEAPGVRYPSPRLRELEWIAIYRVAGGQIDEVWVVSRDLDGDAPAT